MANVGRPTDYKKEYNDQAYKLTLLGHTDKELCIFFDVCEATLNNWKHQHPKFLESIKKGKDIADVEVVMALRKRALGYKYTETTTDSESDVIKVVEKEVAPEVSAQCFWLKNRQPSKWRDKQEITVTEEPTVIRDDIT